MCPVIFICQSCIDEMESQIFLSFFLSFFLFFVLSFFLSFFFILLTCISLPGSCLKCFSHCPLAKCHYIHPSTCSLLSSYVRAHQPGSICVFATSESSFCTCAYSCATRIRHLFIIHSFFLSFFLSLHHTHARTYSHVFPFRIVFCSLDFPRPYGGAGWTVRSVEMFARCLRTVPEGS